MMLLAIGGGCTSLRRQTIRAWLLLAVAVSYADALQVASPSRILHKNINTLSEQQTLAPCSLAVVGQVAERPSRQCPRLCPLFQTVADDVSPRPGIGAAGKVIATRKAWLQNKCDDARQLIPSLVSGSLEGASVALRESWWCLPMCLALVPAYCRIIHGTSASMPSWWPVHRMDHIFHSPCAGLIIGVFLLSNISYFLSGLYLLKPFPHFPFKEKANPHFTRYPLLGTLVLVAGAVSTVYHAFQALGPYHIAESLCYIDHAVAISAVFYFWRRCGAPKGATLAFGLPGIAALAIAGPHYPWLHSAWHLLSSVAAVVWARDGIERGMQKQMTPTRIEDNDDRQGLLR